MAWNPDQWSFLILGVDAFQADLVRGNETLKNSKRKFRRHH